MPTEKPAKPQWRKPDDGYYSLRVFASLLRISQTPRAGTMDTCGSDISCKSNLAMVMDKRTHKCQRLLV